jgi:hypothetical protein
MARRSWCEEDPTCPELIQQGGRLTRNHCEAQCLGEEARRVLAARRLAFATGVVGGNDVSSSEASVFGLELHGA